MHLTSFRKLTVIRIKLLRNPEAAVCIFREDVPDVFFLGGLGLQTIGYAFALSRQETELTAFSIEAMKLASPCSARPNFQRFTDNASTPSRRRCGGPTFPNRQTVRDNNTVMFPGGMPGEPRGNAVADIRLVDRSSLLALQLGIGLDCLCCPIDCIFFKA